MELSGQLHAPATLYLKQSKRFEPHSQSGWFKGGRNLFSLTEIEPRFLDNPPSSLVSTLIETRENYEANTIFINSRNFQHLMGEISLYCSGGPTTAPFSEIHVSISVSHTLLLYIFHVCLMLSSHLHLGLSSGLFPSIAFFTVRQAK
jgi:hypothetical protein